MNFVLCDGAWGVTANGALTCTGTLTSIPQDSLIPAGMNTADSVELAYQAVGLFAVVFGVLAIRKALK
ncbi:hypothetical protein [Pseudomonas sp. 2FE]|uniref:hypothetical protein n=1 Tax=Pseudomonas sp. 2FE TaxID=2502190 RepID=UPI0010F6DC83|nr:hypothetical protein [Pseudomonas sp. 2FE]